MKTTVQKMNKSHQPKIAMQVFKEPTDTSENIDLAAADTLWIRADYLLTNTGQTTFYQTSSTKIFDLRSVEYGGKYKGSCIDRHELLKQAAHDFDIVVLEAHTDLTDEVLSGIDANSRLIAWCGEVDDIDTLHKKYLEIREIPARYYKLTLISTQIAQGISTLQLLKRVTSDNLITYAEGPLGMWSQLLGAYLGNAMIIGNLAQGIEDQEHLLYGQLKNDYQLPEGRKVRQVYGIAGNPVFRSMSPFVHNRCYDLLGMDAIYLPFHVEVFEDFWSFMTVDFSASGLGLTWGGFTMVSPYKEDTFAAADHHLCEASRESKACNILTYREGKSYADSSDGIGVLVELKSRYPSLQALKIAIIGCGGAGRTTAARLKKEKANIVLFNRSEERGKYAAALLALPYFSNDEFDAGQFDVVINATPAGKYGKTLIFDPKMLRDDALCIDMAYSQEDTLLVKECRTWGKKVIEGKTILLHQVKKQFLGLTGVKMPAEVIPLIREKTANLMD